MELIYGDTREIELAFTDPENNDAPLPLGTVNHIWFTVKQSATSPDSAAVFQLTVGNGIEVIDAAAGTALATITPEHWQGMARPRKQGTLVYDVQINRAGVLTTTATGTMTVLPDVTHATPTP